MNVEELVAVVRGLSWAWIALWVGLGLLTVGLGVALSRYGRANPLHSYMAVSLWAHVLFAAYAATVHIAVNQAPPRPEVIRISPESVLAAGDPDSAMDGLLDEPWDPVPEPALATAAVALAAPAAMTAQLASTPTAAAAATNSKPVASGTSPGPLSRPSDDFLPKSIAPAALSPVPSPSRSSAAMAPSTAQFPLPVSPQLQPLPPSVLAPTLPKLMPSVATSSASPLVPALTQLAPLPASLTVPALNARPGAHHFVPKLYELRLAPDHAAQAAQRGGSPETEAAVKAALRWLAEAQSPDGRWDASHFGAGQELRLLGQDRHGAGAHADTGITGLALLAFLGSGHSHTTGDYRPTVTRGLEFLVRSQGPQGQLGGQAELFAFMYCHGMATLALSEAYAMTGDERLQPVVQHAIGYTTAAQNRITGSWRYRPGDFGDTSQLGWQLMALKSAELGGLPIGSDTRERMVRYLNHAASGPRRGLAGYRPGERPTRTMTAEALVCRLFLGLAGDPAANQEAASFVVEELPGQTPANFYFWYYATLALYQTQGEPWRRWNEALAGTLVRGQRTDGALAGSWDPDPVWGAHGGRVYSTALGTLCLEVYYRYLPLYIEAAQVERRPR